MFCVCIRVIVFRDVCLIDCSYIVLLLVVFLPYESCAFHSIFNSSCSFVSVCRFLDRC